MTWAIFCCIFAGSKYNKIKLQPEETNTITRTGQAATPPAPSMISVPDTSGDGSFIMSGGWIKLHRGIMDHWIWSDPVKFKWWVDLLLMANHEPKKVLIGGTLIDCGRGQTVRSLNTLSGKWLVTKKTVKTFLELLQADDMIRIENVKISTRITICNYDTYQDSVNGKETGSKRKVNAKETTSKRELPPNKNDKNDKNILSASQQKETPEEFYKRELEASGDDPEYHKFISFIFGKHPKNDLRLNNVLAMREQLTYKQFKNVIAKFNETNHNGRTFPDLVMDMANKPDLAKKYMSLNLTVQSWLRLEAKRK